MPLIPTKAHLSTPGVHTQVKQALHLADVPPRIAKDFRKQLASGMLTGGYYSGSIRLYKALRAINPTLPRLTMFPRVRNGYGALVVRCSETWSEGDLTALASAVDAQAQIIRAARSIVAAEWNSKSGQYKYSKTLAWTLVGVYNSADWWRVAQTILEHAPPGVAAEAQTWVEYWDSIQGRVLEIS